MAHACMRWRVSVRDPRFCSACTCVEDGKVNFSKRQASIFLSPPATLTVQSQDNGGGNQFSVQTERSAASLVYLRVPACDGKVGEGESVTFCVNGRLGKCMCYHV